MKRTLVTALVGVSLLTATPAVVFAATGDAPDHVVAATQKAADTSEVIKLSDEGYQALRAVRGARIAIFEGQPELAGKMLDESEKSLSAAQKEASKLAVKTDKSDDSTVRWIPVDASLAVADNFVATPEKTKGIAKANEHFRKGEHRKALESLKLAEIDVNYTSVLLPLETTEAHVAEARKLLGQHKYYQANLALKAVEDGLVLHTVALDGAPEPRNQPMKKGS